MEPRPTPEPESRPNISETEQVTADMLNEDETRERTAAIIGTINELLYAGPDGTLDKKLLSMQYTNMHTSDRLKGISTIDASPWIDIDEANGGIVQVRLTYWREKLLLSGTFIDKTLQLPIDRTPFAAVLLRTRDPVVDKSLAGTQSIELLRVDNRKKDEPKLLRQGEVMPHDRTAWDQVDLALDKIDEWRYEPNMLRYDQLATMKQYFTSSFRDCIAWAGPANTRKEIIDKIDHSTTAWFTRSYAEWEKGLYLEAARLGDPELELSGMLAVISTNLDAGFDDDEFIAETKEKLAHMETVATEKSLNDYLWQIQGMIERVNNISNEQ